MHRHSSAGLLDSGIAIAVCFAVDFFTVDLLFAVCYKTHCSHNMLELLLTTFHKGIALLDKVLLVLINQATNITL